MFVSSFSFYQLAQTYFYLNVELMISDFLDRTKSFSIVILSTETTVFKFDLFYEFFFKKIQLEKNGGRLNFFVTLLYFTSDYLHMPEECVNFLSAARCRNYCNNQYKKLLCLFTNGTWEKDTRLCNNYALSHEYFVEIFVR